MLPKHPEELALRRDVEVRERAAFEVGDQGVLSFRLAVDEGYIEAPLRGTVQGLQPESIGLDLISIRPGQRPVEVRDDTDLLRARTVLVGREKALEDRRGRPSLVGAQGYEWGSPLHASFRLA